MRTRLALTALSVLLVTSACGGSDEPATATSEAAPSTSAPSASASSEAPAESSGERTTIFGSVGTEDDPESFVIDLVDADGNSITELPAGDYELQVSDPSMIHNFHLTGPGVDEATEVPATDDVTFDISLEAGDYEYVCDPHVSSMNGSFTVT